MIESITIDGIYGVNITKDQMSIVVPIESDPLNQNIGIKFLCYCSNQEKYDCILFENIIHLLCKIDKNCYFIISECNKITDEESKEIIKQIQETADQWLTGGPEYQKIDY